MMAHLDLTMAEIGFAPTFEAIGLGERVDVSRLVAGLLLRVSQLCDGFAGGQACAVAEMETLRIPIDEFWAMTRPKDRVEQRLRILVAAALELELVERMAPRLDASTVEAASDTTSAWRIVDLSSRAVVQELKTNPDRRDSLSLYARRVIGEAAVLVQGIVVRREGMRLALTGGLDPELQVSTVVVDGLLAAVATRVGALGLSV